MIEMRVMGLVQANRIVMRIPLRLGAELRDAMQRTMDFSLDVMDAYTPVRTGFLKSNNTAEFVDARSNFNVGFNLFNDTPYAGYVAFGTIHMAPEDFVTPALVFGTDMIKSEVTRLQLL